MKNHMKNHVAARFSCRSCCKINFYHCLMSAQIFKVWHSKIMNVPSPKIDPSKSKLILLPEFSLQYLLSRKSASCHIRHPLYPTSHSPLLYCLALPAVPSMRGVPGCGMASGIGMPSIDGVAVNRPKDQPPSETTKPPKPIGSRIIS